MGETDEAVAHLRAAAERHRRVGVLCGEALSLQRLAQALHAKGDTDQAQTALAGALTAARGSPVGLRHLPDRVPGTAGGPGRFEEGPLRRFRSTTRTGGLAENEGKVF